MTGKHGASTPVTVAAISFSPKKFDIHGNARRLEELFREAGARGAQLALAPEGALDGVVAMGVLRGEWPAARALDASATIDSDVIQGFRHLAAELSMSLAFGFAERIGDEIYNTALYISNRGEFRGKYHKMALAEGYHDSWWFNRVGQENRAFDTPLGRCGFMICYDRWDARASRLPVLDGAQFLLVPTYGNRSEHNDKHVLARATENRVPLVQSNGTGAALIISGGEIVARHIAAVENRDPGTVTAGTIHVPTASGTDEQARRTLESDYLRWRDEHLRSRFCARRDEYLQQWGGTMTAPVLGGDPATRGRWLPDTTGPGSLP